jgi:hypothetical protein
MGGIRLDGLPRLSFDIVDRQDAGELTSLGFEFELTHYTVLGQGRTAKTEWTLPCPQTYAHIDMQGDVVWLPPSGQGIRFGKTEHGYAGGNNGEAVTVSPDGNVIEITTPASIKWLYRNGFLESISSQTGYYSVTTDRETILSISKRILNREIFLLKCAYTKQGYLEALEFSAGRQYRLQWSANCDLLAVDSPKVRLFDFEYANSLLACWTKANSPRNELKWQHLNYVRETAFLIPPVLLREDSSNSYVHTLDKWGYVYEIKTYNKAGAVVSDTRIGEHGLEQTTPNGTIKHPFKDSP